MCCMMDLPGLPLCLKGCKHKSVIVVQMSRVHLVFAPVAQISSGATQLGSSGNVGRSAQVNHGDIQ
jgi:hypothetical protein